MKRRGPKRGRTGWQQSVEFRAIGRAAIQAWNAQRAAMPRCDAVRRSDGGRCQQWPMGNGRCYLHGGRTPRKDQWHVVQYPDCSTPKGEAKFNRKLRDRKTYAKKQAAQLAAMTAERRAEHDAWRRTHKPGSEAARRAESARAGQDAEIRRLLAAELPERAADPELERIRADLAKAQAELTRLQAKRDEIKHGDDGVFG